MFTIALIGISLSLDALAVSVGAGVSIKDLKLFHIIRGSLFFGFFQFLMPLIGWYLGKGFSAYIQSYDHWIAFLLLAFIGGKMIKEGFSKKQDDEAEKPGAGDIRNLMTLITLAFATSVDALAAGLSFTLISDTIWGPAGMIGGITFTVCMLGFEFGKRLGALFNRGAQIAGGIILTGIGIKILVEHLGIFA